MRCRLTAAAGVALLLTGCAKEESTRVSAASGPTTNPTVPVVKATRADLAGSITLTGEFIPFQEVDVMSKVAGYVREINVDVGDRVRKGQVLATLEVPEMSDDLVRADAAIEQADAEAARAEDEVRRAEAAHEMAHLSFTRMQNVAKREPGLVPQQDVDEVRSRDLVSEAQVAGAKSSVVAARQRMRVVRADEARLKTIERYETIAAPFDGVITKRYANTGSMIQAGTASQSQAMPVVKISQNNRLRLILPVPESAVAQVSGGKEVEVRVPSASQVLRGRVTRFTGKVQDSTRTMDTEVDVPNPSLSLIPGMYAEVDLHLQDRKGVMTVPVDALDGNGDNARVFTVADPGVIRIVPVKVGLQTARLVEIRQGLEGGDMVVVGRRAGLKEGDRVTAVTSTFTNTEPGK
ncbi:MAG TPA: efflux RND transporter periplasmic adaptor subunit [Bryobacteraceae bacterium]|jgi:RND family efflux transporter MFP subunit